MTVTSRFDIPGLRDPDTGKLPACAWPGGYPVLYITADCGTLCPDCANSDEARFALADCPDDRQWLIAAYYIHWEGPPETCDHCGKQVESAYGDPENE